MTKKRIRVAYYALLRQERGLAEEMIDFEFDTARDLFIQLKTEHKFRLSESQVKVAINSKISPWETPLKHGDSILLMPPVAGG